MLGREERVDRKDWDDRYGTPDLVWTEEPNQILVREVSALSPGRAVDLACGEGRNAIWLAERGWETTGVDFSHVGLEKARQFAERRGVTVRWVEEDLADWEPEHAAYDLVLLAYVQLPASLRSQIHRKAFAAVAPGGRLLVIAHDTTNLREGVGGPQSAEVLFSPEDVLTDIAGGDFTIEHSDRVTRTVQTDQGDKSAIDALVRVRRSTKDKETASGNR